MRTKRDRHGMATLYNKASAILALIGLYKFSIAFFLAKKSLTAFSPCDNTSAASLLSSTLGFSQQDLQRLHELGLIGNNATGCWSPRQVDALAIIVVDALRFDFALDSLPLSVGQRLPTDATTKKIRASWNQNGTSQLFQFVADPPTVTMQRIKGITTGGLPTFFDISSNLGGATIQEDSWVEQLYRVPFHQRWTHRSKLNKIAFVGDDTWMDLFPFQFDERFPYPSFNTRDLDTVDNGCLRHLPHFLSHFGPSTLSTAQNNSSSSFFYEVIVAHFLGVDHVGHTFGPHNQHMYDKLHQIDQALAILLSHIDDATTTCQAAFILGDHGMTEDGNHGGGTTLETHAALFAHFSPGCGDMTASIDLSSSIYQDGSGRLNSKHLYQSIHQIDLVPTISILLGLPIPFSNIGSLVPSLIPSKRRPPESDHLLTIETPFTTTALALNSAQVWQYLITYSESSHVLPHQDLAELKSILLEATQIFQNALSLGPSALDSIAYRKACGLYKYFLVEATRLGQKVWTRFDTNGMIVGVIFLLLAVVLKGCVMVHDMRVLIHNYKQQSEASTIHRQGTKGYIKTVLFGWVTFPDVIPVSCIITIMTFQSLLLTFSNSYILAEKEIVGFTFGLMCLIASLHLQPFHTSSSSSMRLTLYSLLLAFISRVHSLIVTGHGKDPKLQQFASHNRIAFLSSLCVLAYGRCGMIFHRKVSFKSTQDAWWKAILDLGSLVLLACCWIEKSSSNISRNGYMYARLAFLIYAIRLSLIVFVISTQKRIKDLRAYGPITTTRSGDKVESSLEILWILSLVAVTVTGPSAAASLVFFVIQAKLLDSLTRMSESTTSYALHSLLLASMWKLWTRNAFFNTGHACTFSQLQVSAAFIATDKFHYAVAGTSLFLNTFGWEFLGTALSLISCKASDRSHIWGWICYYQLLQTVGSCISVSVLRRHLMVWAVFAPRFMFECIFFVMTCLLWIFFSQ